MKAAHVDNFAQLLLVKQGQPAEFDVRDQPKMSEMSELSNEHGDPLTYDPSTATLSRRDGRSYLPSQPWISLSNDELVPFIAKSHKISDEKTRGDLLYLNHVSRRHTTTPRTRGAAPAARQAPTREGLTTGLRSSHLSPSSPCMRSSCRSCRRTPRRRASRC